MGDKKASKKNAKKAARQAEKARARSAEAGAGSAGVTADARMAELLDAVWEHRVELQRLALDLPVLLADTGRHLQVAGLGAQRASAGLAGEVKELAAHAADMLAASKDQLRTVLAALEGTGAVLRNVPFIGGELGNTVAGGLSAINEVADHLEVAGDKVRTLGERLAQVGADLDDMGGSMLESATALGLFGGLDLKVPAPGAHRTPAKKAPAKKASAKKAASKKAPAKKAASTPSGARTPAK